MPRSSRTCETCTTGASAIGLSPLLKLDFVPLGGIFVLGAVELVVLRVLERRGALPVAVRLQERAQWRAAVVEPDLAVALWNHRPHSKKSGPVRHGPALRVRAPVAAGDVEVGVARPEGRSVALLAHPRSVRRRRHRADAASFAPLPGQETPGLSQSALWGMRLATAAAAAATMAASRKPR